MNDAKVERYIPWADDALLPGESTYALLNKLAWFAGRGPVQLMRDLRVTDTNPTPATPKRIDFGRVVDDWRARAASRIWPIRDSRLSKYFDPARFNGLDEYTYALCESERLRFCPDCIAAGMHFTIAQLVLVEYCPYHHRHLISNCPECGESVSYDAEGLHAAFCCSSCGGSLLAGGLTDIRANLRYRWRVSHAHEVLVRALESAPMILCPTTGCLGSKDAFPGAKEAVTRLLPLERPPSSDPSASPYCAAVRVARNDRGQPCIQPCPPLGFIEQPKPSHPSDRNVHQVAQLRVGAWALRQYHDHVACLCAARELMRKKRLGWFSWSIRSAICCVGKGFAVWEAGCAERAEEQLPSELWKTWGLETLPEKAFASYVLEKACLASAILPFLRNQRSELSGWEATNFASSFSQWKTALRESDRQVILWSDLRSMDFSDVCDIAGCDEGVRLTWLGKVCTDLHGDAEDAAIGEFYARSAMEALSHGYAAGQRAEAARESLHETIGWRGAYPS